VLFFLVNFRIFHVFWVVVDILVEKTVDLTEVITVKAVAMLGQEKTLELI